MEHPHTFQNYLLKEDSAKAQSDAAVPGGFDLYFNFLYGQHEDEIAGIEAIRYLGLRGVTFVGILCLEWTPPLSIDKTASLRFIGIPQRSKLDSHADAERAGIKIRKVGPGGFPLFVEPTKKNVPALPSTRLRSLETNMSWRSISPGSNDLKYHPELHIELFKWTENPKLLDKMPKLAVKALKANRREGGPLGNVEFQIRRDNGGNRSSWK
ncbi:MAG: hypothetical protein Q9199_006927 [Rusavskia elegans]